MNVKFPDRFLKNPEMSNSMKIRSLGAEFFHSGRQTDRQTDGQTDMMKLIVAFRNFSNAPEISTFCPSSGEKEAIIPYTAITYSFFVPRRIVLTAPYELNILIQGGSNMTGTNCNLFTHNQSRSYLNHLV